MDGDYVSATSLQSVVSSAKVSLARVRGIPSIAQLRSAHPGPSIPTYPRSADWIARFRMRIAGRELLEERYNAASSRPDFVYKPGLSQMAAKLREELQGENGTGMRGRRLTP